MTDERMLAIHRLAAAAMGKCQAFKYPHVFHCFHAGFEGTGLLAKPITKMSLCGEIEFSLIASGVSREELRTLYPEVL